MKKNNVTSMIAGGSVLLTLLILLSGFILSMNKISGSDIDDGQQIGHSIFTLYDGKMYAGVLSDGQYVIEAADPGSFKVFYLMIIKHASLLLINTMPTAVI